MKVSYAVSYDKKRSILLRMLEESEELEVRMQFMIKSFMDVNRMDRVESLQSELSQQKLLTESVNQQIQSLIV